MKGEVISRNLSTMCVIVASGIAILSGLSLVAWFYEWPWFLLFFQTSLPINPMSAILFMISGVAIVWKKYSASSRWPTFIFVLLLILSLYVALDKVFIFQWHIDALFFNEKITRYERLTQTGIGMSLVTAISFVIAFASLLIQSQSYRSIILREIIDLGVFFFSVMVLVVYIFHVPESHPFFFMAPLTAVLFAFLSFAALLSRPEDPIIKQLARGHFIYSPASILLPLSLIFPVVLGYVRLQGEWRHIISTELGVTFIILTFMLVLFTTTWFIARSFNQRMKLVNDYQLQANELTAANEELQSLTEELTANVEALAETNKALAQANTTIAKQKDEQLNRVLDFTKDVIWSFDLTGHGQNYLSHSAERIYQRPYHELIERPYFWIENVHPEDIEIVNSNRQRLETSGQVESTYRLMLNGKIHWFHDECRLVKDEQGIPQRLEGVASDVTEKVRQDLLLKEHQQQLEIIFNRTHDIFILLDENVRTLQFNKAALDMSIEISGVPLQAGKNYLDSAPPFRKRELEQIIDRVFAGESVTLITDFPGRSGKMIHYKVVYEPVVTNGKITHISIGGTDISEIQQKELQVKEYHENLEIIFQNTTDFFALIDTQAKLLALNRPFENFIRTYSKIEPKAGISFYDVVAPNRLEAARSLLNRALQGERIQVISESIFEKETRYYDVIYAPVIKEGVVTHVTVTSTDITEQKRQEIEIEKHRQNLDIIFQNATDFFALLNANAEIVLINKPLQEYVRKHTTIDPVPGTSFYDIVTLNRKEIAREQIHQVLNGERINTIAESVYQNEISYYNVIYTPVKKNGVVTNITITSTDITEKKKQEQLSRHYQDTLEIIFKTSIDTFLLVSEEGKVVSFNEAFEKFILKVTSIQPKVGMDLLDVVPSHRRAAAYQLFAKALLGERSAENVEYKDANGEKIFHYLRYEPVITDGVVKNICISAVDVTAFRKIEEELKQKQNFLDRSSDSAGIGYWTCEPDLANGQITWSKQMFEIFGVKENEFSGRASFYYEFIPTEDFEMLSTAIKKAMGGEVPLSLDHRIILRDGTEKWISETTDIIRDAKENIQLVFGVTHDITERKMIENELKKDQYFLEKASESAKIGYWTSEPGIEHGRLTWSKEVFKIFDVREEDFKGINECFFSRVHPDDRDKVSTLSMKALEENATYDLDHRIVLSDGSSRWVNEKAQVLRNTNGKPTLMVGVVQDINDRKVIEGMLREYNERFEVLSKATNDAIWDWDIEKNVEIWNHGLETIFGYKQREITNATQWWAEKVHPDDYTRVMTDLNQVMTNHQTNWTTEYRYKCANGFYKNVLDRAYVLYSGHKAIRMIGAMQDITEITEYRHSLERKVEKRTLELQAALSKEKEMVDLQKRFISIASHEFRTPLSTISLAAGFIKKFHQKLTSFEIKKRLDSIDTQVVRMNDLLQDVLTVSKIDSGKDEVHWKDIDLKEIIESIVAEVGNSTQGTHQINFIWKCKQQQFKSDENKIRTILINLLNNAVKFSQEKIDLEVSCSKNEVRLRVKDYGVGIPQEEIGKLFQPFYRASNASFITGTGLGLSIVSKAVEMLGGRIEVQSELNKGTEFKMQLPIQ